MTLTDTFRPLAIVILALACSLAHADDNAQIRDSVVKIFTTQRNPDFESPWTKQTPQEISGTGFVISGDRILTNAHMVEMASQIFVQPPHSADKIRAEVIGIAQGIDLAVIQLRREDDRVAFREGHPALSLSDQLPTIGSTVQAIGYPLGGQQISLTEGVVSRIEFTAYAQETAGLRIQIDAALNHGNSGGPVVQDGKVIGVVFSGIESADNIGYVIPVEEVEAFLTDIDDGQYDGRARLLVRGFQTAENPDLRDWLGLSYDQTGLLFTGVGDDLDDEDIVLEPWDLIDRVGDEDVDNAGMITIGDNLRLNWAYMIPILAPEGSGTVPVTVLRDGEQVQLDVPVTNKRDEITPALGDEYPEYFIVGPLVFSPARIEHLQNFYAPYLAMQGNPAALRAGQTKDFPGEEIVMLVSDFLPHPITKGYKISYKPAVKELNGVKIESLTHLVEMIRDSDEDFLNFTFYDKGQETLVFHRQDLLDTTEEILEDNSIRNQGSDRFMEIWED
ncbi:MAG: peptidase S1 [Phycisphaerae bacterium]|nr:peptidase S1 [Phycisphaerae bacterium]MBM90780.1 peptidase S1 [Phycisphaerae bacterium]HCT46047.1 serine protease [Phycisphaerales bacterium]